MNFSKQPNNDKGIEHSHYTSPKHSFTQQERSNLKLNAHTLCQISATLCVCHSSMNDGDLCCTTRTNLTRSTMYKLNSLTVSLQCIFVLFKVSVCI
mmetsp:Transcript_2636/g.10070  ORF Transcript_2636/g.10070 Transcript_2636/m.10070 type:complete len:96 (+) Transcript_2636:447-734(+)